jgi:hypothetical protein
MNDVVQKAADILHRATIDKAKEVERARATYRGLLLADDAQPGDGAKLAKALTALGLTVSDAYADAKVIVARQKVVAEIAATEAEGSRLGTEADALQPLIAGILRDNRDPRRANESVGRQEQLRNLAEKSAFDARRLRAKLRDVERSAPRIYGKW